MKLIKLLIISLLITSCATIPEQSALQPLWEAHQQSMQKIDMWQLNGRIVISDEDSAWNSRVIWQQRPRNYQLVFNSPVGGAMRLIGSEQQVVMNTADNKTFRAETPEKLVSEVLNMNIPVQNLHYWIRGIPAPTQRQLNYILNENGQLQLLEQEGWTVSFKRYKYVDGVALPEKVFLQNEDYRVKIAVNRWQPMGL
ncbi:lipoprotein insertase outer membrane protein LolB [Candidatus Albibeggiatoa sp. nov. NOAA]|uniref:lipoprotein insertase outer membrane protein LolB n=1 Tax=Candidatus Albibeggiatoa sp. nov. NOAA TaxID=3162724 RepID=UPI00330467DE|nr:lipoprotein insertase outer membrane protein LolB [Thiotrichaceae bacterium]